MKISILALALLLPLFSQAASVRLDTDLGQGFAFSPASKLKVGHITYLQVGGVVLDADLPAKDPRTGREVRVVGMLDLFDWNGIRDAPLNFQFNVSLANQQKIQALLRDPYIPLKTLQVGFVVYSHDPNTNMYYVSLYPSPSVLEAKFLVTNSRVVFNVRPEPYGPIPSPLNFAAYLSVIPPPKDQDLHYSASMGNSERMGWYHSGP